VKEVKKSCAQYIGAPRGVRTQAPPQTRSRARFVIEFLLYFGARSGTVHEA
jgi:hypothetical protein